MAIGPAKRAEESALTPRETTVLPLTDVLTVEAIGRRPDISVLTMHKHVKNIYRKLGTHDRMGPTVPQAIPSSLSGLSSSLDVTRSSRPVHRTLCSGWTRVAGEATIPMLVAATVRCAGPRAAA